jgi:hypothetical protein
LIHRSKRRTLAPPFDVGRPAQAGSIRCLPRWSGVRCSAFSGCGHRPLHLLPVHTLQLPRHLRTYYSTGCTAASLSWRFPSQSDATRSQARVVLRPQFIRNPDHDMTSNMLATIPIGRIYNTATMARPACLAWPDVLDVYKPGRTRCACSPVRPKTGRYPKSFNHLLDFTINTMLYFLDKKKGAYEY